MIPLRTDVPLRSTPWANYLLVAINVVVFFVQRWNWAGELHTPGALDPRDPHLINYFTYQFLHGDAMHLAGNMLFLYIFGNNVADRIGNVGYLAFYLAGGVAAGIGHVLSDVQPVIGASGSVSAVTGAFIVLLPRSHVTVLFFFFIISSFEIPSVWLIVASFLKDFVLGFGDPRGTAQGVAHVAHFAGSVFGFSISFALLTAHLLPRDQFDLFALAQRWNRRRQYRDLRSTGWDPFGVTPPATRKGAINPNLERIQDVRARISDALSKHQLEQATNLYLELRAIDPNQVLARQSQLDVANTLYTQEKYAAAADAYELFLRQYYKADEVEQVQLMLGILYARYLNDADKARPHLSAAAEKLQSSKEGDLARAELARLGGALSPGP
jgi:membrane associated rhomboid family serine protease